MAAPKRSAAVLTGGIAVPEGVTVNTAEDFMEEVLAVMVNDPAAAAGMVIEVLKVPDAAVLKEKVVDPTITVPVVAALNPVPLTVTAEPAGPLFGFRYTWAEAGAAWTGWMAAKLRPSPTTRPVTSVFTILNTAVPAIGWWPEKPQVSSVPADTCPDPRAQSAFADQDWRKFFWKAHSKSAGALL